MAVAGDEGTTGAPPAPRKVSAGFRRMVGWLLRTGAAVAMLLLLAGLVVAYADGGSVLPPNSLSGPSLAGTLRSGGPSGLMLAGLLVLVLTPVVRVGTSFAMFAVVRDRPFMVITVVVLALLAGTAVVGGL